MITSSITILCEGNNRLTYETKKPRNDEDLARRLGPTDRPTDRRTDKPAYRDARTHLKSIVLLYCKVVSDLFSVEMLGTQYGHYWRRTMLGFDFSARIASKNIQPYIEMQSFLHLDKIHGH